MSRFLAVYLFLILVPAATLAFLAIRVADHEYTAGIETRDERLQSEADALRHDLETALEEMLVPEGKRGNQGNLVGYAREERWIGYSTQAEEPHTERAGSEILAEDQRYFELATRGGESYEFDQVDPELAIDAYAFYLPRIKSSLLRSRLRFKIARAAYAAGKPALGQAINRDLVQGAGDAFTEEGFPIDLLAAFSLFVHSEEAPETQRAKLRDELSAIVARRASELPTSLLHLVTTQLDVSSPELDHLTRERRTLESAVMRHPELLRGCDAVLDGNRLLLAANVGDSDATDTLRTVTSLPIRLPQLSSPPTYEARLVTVESDGAQPTNGASRDASNPSATSRRIRLGVGGPVIGTLHVTDTGYSVWIKGLVDHRLLQRVLVACLVIATLAGGAALITSISRKRRLARLLANASHELKAPATSILMCSELLASEDLSEPKKKHFAGILHVESLRLSRLIENVLEFSRLDPHDKRLRFELVDLSELVHRVHENFSYRAREHDVDLRLEDHFADSAGGQRFVVTNGPAIERILFNLLDNSLKYRSQKDAIVTLTLARELQKNGQGDGEDTGTDRGQDFVVIGVADNGVGISADHRAHVFQELYRSRFEAHGTQGTGLALTITRRLAHKLGGEIDLETKENEGSTFTLRLPIPPSTGSEAFWRQGRPTWRRPGDATGSA